ncbi:MAG: N-acetyltransferase [Isosphaera sp.]|nr:N-acetyltransferase [Isosphaera sp.]
MTVPVVERLTRRDERAAVASLSEAFADYQFLTTLCPDPARRARAVGPYCRLLFRIAARRGAVFATADRAAVACTFPPGSEWPGAWAYLRAGVLSAAWRLGFRSGWRFLRLGSWFDATRAKHVGGRPHWYVILLGVRPAAQGRGLGRAVLGPVFAAADRAGVPVYLETVPEANVAVYRRLGFDLVGRTEFPGGLPNWELCREPR